VKRFTVIACFVGECCVRPHLWVQGVSASTPDAAWLKARGEMGEGKDVAEYFVVNGDLTPTHVARGISEGDAL
jgi:hypothetical protein